MTPEVKPLTTEEREAIAHVLAGSSVLQRSEENAMLRGFIAAYEATLRALEARAEGAASSVPAPDAEAIVAIRDIMELSHRDVLREWTSKKGNVADGSVSIQTMRLALISRALTRHAWSAAKEIPNPN